MEHWGYTFPRTIYKIKKDRRLGFLDPWDSLSPSLVYRHLRPEIIAQIISDKKKPKIAVSPLRKKPKLSRGQWFLSLPRRSYTPPDYPHLQLWYLSRQFTPTLSLLPPSDQKNLILISWQLWHAFKKWGRRYPGQFAFGINATPFSFVRRRDGRYWPGGQSVRMFHASYLWLPRITMMKRQAIREQQLSLIYPLDFSLALFKFWFHLRGIQEYLFTKKRYHYYFNERGLVIKCRRIDKQSIADLLAFLIRFDHIAYQIELIMIYALYKESERFLSKLNRFLLSRNLEEIYNLRQELILPFAGRPAKLSKELLLASLLRLASNYSSSKKETSSLRFWPPVTDTLVLSADGRPASSLGSYHHLLRPGMGYGYLLRFTASNLVLTVTPLDSLEPKGIIEANGFLFSEKIFRHQLPNWFFELARIFRASGDRPEH